MQVLGAAPPALTKEQLIKKLSDPLKQAIQSNISGDYDTDKVQQYANASRNQLMYRGFQHLGRVQGADGIASFQAIGGGAGAGAGTAAGYGQDTGAYSYTNNIFRGNGRKFIAVIGQRAPNVTAMPDDPNSEKGERSSRAANKGNAVLDSWWNVDERNMEAAEVVWTMGPAFIYTPWNADGDLYGWREEPIYEESSVPAGEAQWQCIQCGANEPPTPEGTCPQCGTPMGPESQTPAETLDVPKATGTRKYPNGQVECHITNVLYVSTPFFTRELKRCPWLRFEKEEYKGDLLKSYPQLRSKMDEDGNWSDSGTSAIGRQARDAVMSPTGMPTRQTLSRWNYTRIWFQTTMYELVQNEEVRAQLAENYPEGLKISMVNGEIVDLENERLDHVWAVIKPEAGEGINLDGVGQDLVSSQLATNQALNIGMETLERGIPMTLADPRVWNFEQIRKRQSKPAEFIPALPAVGDRLSDSFYPTPAATFSEQMVPFVAGFQQSSTENVGITPAIFGGGNAATAREAEINKNAAMMQLGITWTYFRKGWEAAKQNGIRQLAKHGPSVVQEGKYIVEMSELLEGGWHFQADEAIPTTWGQMRDLLMFMMEKPPAVLEAWGYNHPDNIEKQQKLLGMQGWYTPNMDDIQKFKEVIAELVQQQPIQQPKPDGGMDIQPSIPADEYEDNHVLASQFVQAWAQSEVGRMARKETPEGYANVIAWGKAHAAMANPPAPPPPPITPKVSVSVSSKDLAPNQTAAILGETNLQIPPPEMPGMPPAPPPPGGAPPLPIQ